MCCLAIFEQSYILILTIYKCINIKILYFQKVYGLKMPEKNEKFLTIKD